MFIQNTVYIIYFLLGIVHLIDSLVEVRRHESQRFSSGYGGFLRIGVGICQMLFTSLQVFQSGNTDTKQ